MQRETSSGKGRFLWMNTRKIFEGFIIPGLSSGPLSPASPPQRVRNRIKSPVVYSAGSGTARPRSPLEGSGTSTPLSGPAAGGFPLPPGGAAGKGTGQELARQDTRAPGGRVEWRPRHARECDKVGARGGSGFIDVGRKKE